MYGIVGGFGDQLRQSAVSVVDDGVVVVKKPLSHFFASHYLTIDDLSPLALQLVETLSVEEVLVMAVLMEWRLPAAVLLFTFHSLQSS